MESTERAVEVKPRVLLFFTAFVLEEPSSSDPTIVVASPEALRSAIKAAASSFELGHWSILMVVGVDVTTFCSSSASPNGGGETNQ